MIRDSNKPENYFIEFFKNMNDVVLKNEASNFSNVLPDKIFTIKRLMIQFLQNGIKCKYSAGFHPIDLKCDLIKAINYTYESWDGFWLMDYKKRKLNQYYLSAYDEMLLMLSIGYLLEISTEDFQKLVDVIDRDGVKDNLFEFIIKAKMPERKLIETESYEFGWKLFGKIREAILEQNKNLSEKLVKEFITKDWYKEHRSSGWWGSHKLEKGAYTGYWSFETAAVVKIMGLDDSSFKGCQYYPADMVHWKDIPYYETEIKEEKKGFFGKLFGK
jgi:Domain of unknown function (DUF1911)/Domain of unknown function (DUF1910)